MGIKVKEQIPLISWEIASKVYCNPKHNFCRLCLTDKLQIIKFPNQDTLLNKRSEYARKCTHGNKNLINKVK